MKKILTLAIALIMAFATAAPAFAAGWNVEIPQKKLEDITLKIQALSWDKVVNTAMWDGNNGYQYQILEKAYPAVKDTPVRALVTVTIPKTANLSDGMIGFLKGTISKVCLKIETSNLADVKVFENDATTETGKKIFFTSADVSADKEMTYNYIITGKAISSEKNATITAKFGVFNEWINNTFKFSKNGKTYTVTHSEDLFTVKSSSGAEVAFPTLDDKKGLIDTKRYITVNGGDKIFKQANNTIAFESKDSGTVFSDPENSTYKKLKAQMDEIFGVLGFDYEGAKYMQEAHFTTFFGAIMEDTDALTYPNGYIEQLVTSNPSVNPPQTGDNVSVVGFVMIAVALVAAAAVKRVRA